MKKIVYTLVLAFALISTAASAQNVISENEVNIEINHNTSREELSQMFTDLSAVGITFKYRPQFDHDRKLIGIEYRIFNSEGVELGAVEQTPLTNPAISTKIILAKTDGHFAVVCLGTCN